MSIVLTILVFTLIVVIHEGGHFLMARKCGIFVEEFSVGMGPVLLHRKTKKGLEVSLRLFPIGGFCRMKGEEPDPDHPDEKPDPDSFNGAAIWKRALVVAAGPVMNFILAFVLLLVFNLALGYTSREIETVDMDYPAYEQGLVPGDTVIGLNGERIHVFGKISFLLMNYQEGEEVTLVVKNAEGEKRTLQFPLKYDEELNRYRMGFSVSARGSIAEESAVRGFFPAFFETIAESFWYTGYEIEITIRSLGMLLTGKVGIDALTGPIGMVSVVGETYQEAARYGFMTVLASIGSIIILISANLGILNLFPIPGLDGSRLIFLLVEKIRKKPMNPKIENAIYIVGFVLLFGLMIAVAFNDILRLIR